MKRFAVLVASSEFPNEPGLQDLRCPPNDVDGLRRVLTSKPGGLFDSKDIAVLKNRPHDDVHRGISEILIEAGKNDLVVIYYSGHGKLGRSGELYLCTPDTEARILAATSVPVELLKTFIDGSDCTQVALILDCCFSGAAGGAFAKSSVQDQLDLIARGRGTYVMTASSPTQVAIETEEEEYSLFTKHILEGLGSDDADTDGNGLITMDELYAYVQKSIRADASQEPMKSGINVSGELVIAATRGRPRRERGKRIRKKLSGLLQREQIPDDIVFRARNITTKDKVELTETEQRLDELLDRLGQGAIGVGGFVREWDQVAPSSAQPVVDEVPPAPEGKPAESAITREAPAWRKRWKALSVFLLGAWKWIIALLSLVTATVATLEWPIERLPDGSYSLYHLHHIFLWWTPIAGPVLARLWLSVMRSFGRKQPRRGDYIGCTVLSLSLCVIYASGLDPEDFGNAWFFAIAGIPGVGLAAMTCGFLSLQSRVLSRRL